MYIQSMCRCSNVGTYNLCVGAVIYNICMYSLCVGAVIDVDLHVHADVV